MYTLAEKKILKGGLGSDLSLRRIAPAINQSLCRYFHHTYVEYTFLGIPLQSTLPTPSKYRLASRGRDKRLARIIMFSWAKFSPWEALMRGFFHDYWKTFSLMILHYDRSTPGESLVRYIMLWNPKYEAEVLQREPITSNEKTLVMQLGPTSLKRIALSYSLPRGSGILDPQSSCTFFYPMYLERTAKF